MFTADAHADTLYAMAIKGGRIEHLMVNREKLEKGNVGLQTFALFSGMSSDMGTPRLRAGKMLERIDALNVPIIRGQLPEFTPDAPHGILSIEGGEILEGDMERLYAFVREGVKMIALTWNYENQIAYPAQAGSKKGLKPFGRELLAEMDRLGILADVSHLSDAGIDDVLSLSKLPVIASHSNARWVMDVPRNLTREHAREIAKRRGFIGINFYNKFLTASPKATMDDITRHIDALCEAGAAAAIGFGSDFDGIEIWPEGLDGADKFPRLLSALEKAGYSGETLTGIAGMNLWRTLKAAQNQAAK